MGNPIVFIILAAIALASALGMLLSRNAVHSALFLVLNFSTIAVLFLVLNAPFLFVTQITIYAGAIMVLFLFVVMLLGAERLRGSGSVVGAWQLPVSLLLALMLFVTFVYVIVTGGDPSGSVGEAPISAGPAAIGVTLFESYVFPFEVASVLLLVAMVGVVVLRTRRGKDG
jgi:NADH-quinone oxidoreductase subunit J